MLQQVMYLFLLLEVISCQFLTFYQSRVLLFNLFSREYPLWSESLREGMSIINACECLGILIMSYSWARFMPQLGNKLFPLNQQPVGSWVNWSFLSCPKTPFGKSPELLRIELFLKLCLGTTTRGQSFPTFGTREKRSFPNFIVARGFTVLK